MSLLTAFAWTNACFEARFAAIGACPVFPDPKLADCKAQEVEAKVPGVRIERMGDTGTTLSWLLRQRLKLAMP